LDFIKKAQAEPVVKPQVDNSQQSGNESKSSEILIETEEELHTQKICKVLTDNLSNNAEWQTYIKNHLDPILELEKGKLCQDDEREDSTNNIFDDDFIRSDFGVGTSNENSEEEDGLKF
jgi:hypothetical protein